MAVNPFETHCDKIPSKSLCSSNSLKICTTQPCRLVKINFAADDNMSITTKRSKSKKFKDLSPYLSDNKIQLHAQVTEKRLVVKKAKGIVSSFNLAENIYKAHSDEFKSTKRHKKIKKSVLTLPNEHAPAPHTCTVSDMNDSEYDNSNADNIKLRTKKKLPIQNCRKPRVRPKREFEFYDRDARFCSQMNVNLDCSSTDILKNRNGDGNKSLKRYVAKNSIIEDDCMNPHDVWAVLRDISRFQFRPSPPLSEESHRTPKKKKTLNKKRNKRKDTRILQTCHTEEFAYISSFDIDSQLPPDVSPTSSFDRITVIDKHDKFDEMCQEFEKRIAQTRSLEKRPVSIKGRHKHTAQPIGKSSNNIAKTCKTKENTNQLMLCDSRGEHPNLCDIDVETYVAAVESNGSDVNRKSTSTYPSTVNLQSPRYPSTIHTENEIKNSLKNKTSNCKGIIHGYEKFDDNMINSDNLRLSNIHTNTRKEAVNKLPESEQHTIGITKVVLSKGQNMALANRLELQKRNARLLTSLPSGVIVTPKLTQTEIKRQLRNIKFPLVILGKDQVSSNIQVMNQDPPQFSGLDKQVWPFMVKWNDNKSEKEENSEINPKIIDYKTRVQRHNGIDDCNNSPKIAPVPNKQTYGKDRKVKVDSVQIKKKLEQKRPFALPDNNVKLQAKKPKPMRQFKDKVIKFLYRKSSAKNLSEDESGNILDNKQFVDSSYNTTHKLYASTEMNTGSVFTNDSSNDQVAPSLIDKKSGASGASYPWSKAKWASDFIDAVIRKIKNGVYYSQELNQKPSFDASMQTTKTSRTSCSTYCDTEDLDTATALISENLYSLNTLPGFEKSLPELEIKTLNMNQIEVKHSVTNIMVQFDVEVPIKPKRVINVKNSPSVIAVKLTESNTQIYKCKTSILNAMLPAELCSLLPKMLHRIMNTNLQLSTPLIDKTGSYLSTISETSGCESPLIKNSLSFIPTHINITPKIRTLTQGMFSNAKKHSYYFPPKICCNNWLVMDLMPKLSINFMFGFDKYPMSFITLATKTAVSQTKEQMFCTNTELETHTGIHQSNRLISTFKPNEFLMRDLMSISKKFFTNYKLPDNVTILLLNSPIQINCVINNISMNMTISNCLNGIKTNVNINLSDLKMNSLFNWFQKAFVNQNKALCHESGKEFAICTKRNDNKTSQPIKIDKMENSKKHVHTSHSKMRRKGFLKLYRKTKSTPNMCLKNCTSLSKIKNLEDFLEVIGSERQLSCVFDDRFGKKIISSIIEMKSWMSEINSRQALLILLLMNKKDTPNLVRFRPILLQGIAVNRITRGAELDMEIEVIERENLDAFLQYDGICYLEKSIENHDNLLEELYWIAKTTASDYQRPFDESSENLLKALLEKRKKLNPSYLRVMARYVGLGLLKAPIKTNNK